MAARVAGEISFSTSVSASSYGGYLSRSLTSWWVLCAVLMGAGSPVRGQAPGDRPLIVRGLSFEGNHAIDNYTLEVSIATTNSSFAARWGLVRWIGIGDKKYFNETEFRRDVLRVILLYRQSGYPQVHVDTIVRRSEDAASVRFLISEGPPVVVRSIDISGTGDIVPQRDLLRDIPLAVGDPFNRFLFDASADTIRAAFRDRGYPFAEVFRSFDVDEDSLVARVAFEMYPDGRAGVDTVLVEGTQRIPDEVVRRMIPLRSGDLFRQSALYEAQRDLYRLGIFNYVNVELADSQPGGPGDSTVALRVQVSEGALNRVRIGAGYGTVDCFRALMTWTTHNALGSGRAIDLTARASKIGAGDPFALGLERNLCQVLKPDTGTGRLGLNYNVTLSLRTPFVFSRRTSTTLSVFAERHSEVQAYVREVVGGNLSVTQQTPWDVPVTVSYHLSYGSTSAEAATFCSFLLVCNVQDTTLFTKPRIQSMISAGFVRNRTNSVVDPTRGMTLSGETRYASPAIGSDSLIEFIKGTAELASYHPLGRQATFAWRVRGGVIVSPRLLFLGQSVKYVPPAERFYAGGPNSVRGYPQNGLGPVVRVESSDTVRTGTETTITADTLIAPTGGNRLLIANAELRFPLPLLSGRVGAALFVDAGQAFGGEREFIVDVSDMRITPGVGLRLATPLGPMRLDVAYNPYGPQQSLMYQRVGQELRPLEGLHPADPSAPSGFFDRLRWHFAVGQPF